MMLGGRAAHCMVVAFTLAGLLSGCAGLPTGRFDALAAASKAVDTNTVEADSDIVKLTRHYMIFSPAPGPYKIDSFAPVIEVQGQKRDFDFGPRLEPRDAALDVLASYTDALAAYKDAVDRVKAATEAIGAADKKIENVARVIQLVAKALDVAEKLLEKAAGV